MASSSARFRIAARALMALTVVLVAACGSDDTSQDECKANEAVDRTTETAPVIIDFGGRLGNKYSPACVKVKAGQSVTWSGDFDAHPLVGGTVSGGRGTVDPASPVTAAGKNATTSATVQFTTAGTFPYYCTVHISNGMVGTVFVE